MSLKLNERYPARFNNPTAGYPQGSFKNRTTPTAKDGSYLEKDWANDKEGFFQSLLSAAGIMANGAVDAVGASQFFDALQALKQIQAGTAFTTAGSAGALTLTPTPAISAYSAPQRFRVKFSQASTGSDTLNISGRGAKSIKQYDSTGAKVSAVFAANQLADVEYDGVDIVLLNRLPAGIPPGTVVYFAASTLPAGYLKANGATANISTFPALFAAIGTTWGGDGLTTFVLPDLRGEFIRGTDEARGADPGRVFGSSQSDAFKSHFHTTTNVSNSTVGSDLSLWFSSEVGSGSLQTPSAQTNSTGGTETRPRNVALLACIKY